MSDPSASTVSHLSALTLGPGNASPASAVSPGALAAGLSKQAVDKATLFKYRLENYYRTSVGECIERDERGAEVERRIAGRAAPAGSASWSGVMAADAAALSGQSSLASLPSDSGNSSRQSSLASLAGLTGSGAQVPQGGVWMSEDRKAKIVRDHKRKVCLPRSLFLSSL